MALSEIVGHSRPLSILRRALSAGRVAHAYLFVGPEGVGKATVAWSFAKALQCPRQEGDACETCDSCVKVSHGNHPDVIGVEPTGSQIRIDQIRDLQRQMIHRPLEGRWRTIVMDRAQDMTPHAANALLKILEEPPEGNVMILIALSTSSLLPTVVSRCQALHFPPLSPSEISRFLQEREGWSEADARKVAIQARGSVQRALALKENRFLEQGNRLIELLEDLPALSGAQILQRAHSWAGNRQEALMGLELVQSLLRDLVLLQLGRRSLDHEDSEEQLSSLASSWRIDELLVSWEWVVEAIQGIERNWNPLLVMEQLFLRFSRIKGGSSHMGGWMHPSVGV